ncbi:MAG: hypothetical protein HY226_01595 [Candidatus Vogelbacteria bacterium]|nr:hypothetical protein [Candidatus Vogelbacteria bacterium]
MLENVVQFATSDTGRICLVALLLVAITFFAEISLVNIFAALVHCALIWTIYAISSVILTKTNIFLCLLFALPVSYLYVKRSNQTVPSRPAYTGLVKILGRKTKTYCADGIKFYPPAPLFSIDLIPTEPIIIESETDVVLPDGSKARFPYKLIASPSIHHLHTYIDKGEAAGIKKILMARVEPVLRVWASSDEEGPADWREARASGADVVARIAKPLLGKCLDDIPSEIPTPCLLRYFTVPRPKPNKRDIDQFGKGWEKLTDTLRLLDPKELATLKAAITRRRIQISNLAQVQGNFRDDGLGILIHGFSLGKIQILGGVEEAATSKVREEEAGQGSIAEFKVDMQKAREYMDAVNTESGTKKMSLDEAYNKIAEDRRVKESRSSQAVIIPDLTRSLTALLEVVKETKK